MTKRIKIILEYTMDFATNSYYAMSILGVCLSIIAVTLPLVEKLYPQEAIFGGVSLTILSFVGVFSLYFARWTKRLTRRPRIFLSYSRDNTEQALMLRKALSNKGAYVWFDEINLRAGDDLKATIEAAIENSNTMVVMISPTAGPNVKWEVDAARTRRVPVLAVLQRGSAPPPEYGKLRTVALNSDGSNLDEITTAAMEAGKV